MHGAVNVILMQLGQQPVAKTFDYYHKFVAQPVTREPALAAAL